MPLFLSTQPQKKEAEIMLERGEIGLGTWP
jgi:hypothetical protein